MRLKRACVDAGQYGLNVSADQYIAAGSGVRLLRTSDLKNGRLSGDSDGIYVDGPIEKRFLVRQNDVLMSRSGTLGRTYLVPHDAVGMAFAGFLVRFRPRPGTDPRYLSYALSSAPVQETIRAEAVTSTIQNFNAERYANLNLTIPEEAEQRRIADYLDAECARLDRLIELRSHHISLVRERASAELDSIVKFDGPTVRLGRLATIQSGITVDAGRPAPATEEVPYLRVANVQAGKLDLTEVKTIAVVPNVRRRYLLRDGDVLMTEGGDLDKLGRGTVWRCEIAGAIHQNHVFAVRPRRDTLLADYLACVTAASPARRYFESTGNKTTNLASTSSSKVLDFRLPLLPLADQQTVIDQARDSARHAEMLADSMQRSVWLLRERKQAVITSAVTGEFDVSTASGRGV